MKSKPTFVAVFGLAIVPLSYGETVTLTPAGASEARGTVLSFNSSGATAGTGWSDGGAPSEGNDYVVSLWGLRTPQDGNSHTFGGDSLTLQGDGTIDAGGINFNGTGNTAVLTIPHLILEGGLIRHNNSSNDLMQLAGTLEVRGTTSAIHSKQGPTTIHSAITGTAPLLLLATDVNNAYAVTFASPDNTYTGNLTTEANLTLAPEAVWQFAYQDGEYNTVSGSGTFTVNGTFRISLPEIAEGVPEGTQWTLVGTAVGYGANFAIEGWTRRTDWLAEGAPGSWVSLARPYRFNLTTGVLERIAAKEATVNGNTVYVAHDWIEAYFGEGSVAGFDANADSDGDGYSNYDEYLAGSDPDNGESIPSDRDGDGLPDEWEIEHFGNLAQGPDDDTDGDYNTNLEEYLAETDPASADDFPIVYVVEVDSFVNEGWIEYYFGDVSGFAPLADEDGDGYSNFEEYEAGTDPLEMFSSPSSGSHGIPDGWVLYYFADPEKTREEILSEFDPLADSDGDRVINSIEYLANTNPVDAASSLGTALGYWRFEEATSGEVPGGGNNEYAYPTSIQDSSSYGNHMMTWADYTQPNYSDNVPFAVVPQSGAENQSSVYFERNTLGVYFIEGLFTTPSNLLDPPGGFLRTVHFNEFTVEASFSTTLTGQWQVPVAKFGNPVAGQPPFSLKIDPSNNLRAGIVDGSGVAREIIGTTVIETDAWYSAAVTATATELKLWLKRSADSDYQLEGTAAISGESGAMYIVDDVWAIGKGMWNGGETDAFAGYIDEVRISAVVLDPSEFLNSGDSTGPIDPTADSDGDGTPDVIEEALGLDPNDPTEFFRATLVTGSGTATLSWPSAGGLSFTVERSTTLESWEEVAVVSGAAGTWTDPSPPSGRAFYRVAVNVETGG